MTKAFFKSFKNQESEGEGGGVRTPVALPCTITTTKNRFYFKISPARGLLLPLKKEGSKGGGGRNSSNKSPLAADISTTTSSFSSQLMTQSVSFFSCCMLVNVLERKRYPTFVKKKRNN
jgi:hypothetical protein